MLKELSAFLKQDRSHESLSSIEEKLRLALAAIIWQALVADGILKTSEEEKAASLLRRSLGITEDAAVTLLRDASSLNDRTELGPLIEALEKGLSQKQRNLVLRALVDVCRADGDLAVSEAVVCEIIAARLGIKCNAV